MKTICLAILLIAMFSTTAYALDILYEHSTTYQPTRGISYERNRMMTANGMLDVHVLTVNLNEPYIYIAPVASNQNLGRKETTSSMLRNAGAVAGINADFFGLAGSYSVHFGPMINDGQLLALNAHTNHTYNQFATFLLDVNNNSFFRYIQTSIRFYNNGVHNIETNAYNTVGNSIEWPMVVSHTAMSNTQVLDERTPGILKVVVSGETIIEISEPGQVVDIPQDGYVVLIPYRMAYRRRYFNVGDRAVLIKETTIDLTNMQMAIGGGGLILANGAVVNDQGTVPAGRQPRSAIGTSRDGNRLVLMTVDGRSHSVGATHADMAFLMDRFGAYNAMHFDGGGSSTMVTSARGYNHSIVNTLSEGSERRVINAFGVFDNAPIGAMSQIVMEMEAAHTVVGIPLAATVYGADTFFNHIPVDIGNVSFSGDGGTWQNNLYTPTRSGVHVLEAAYGGFRITQTIYVGYLAELQTNITSLTLLPGERAHLNFTGIATNGSTVAIPRVSGTVYPASLGHFQNNEFIAEGTGVGFITASVGGIRKSIPLTVGGLPQQINMFSGQVGQLSAPAQTQVAVTSEYVQNHRIIQMRYVFEPMNATQAAYVTFYPALAVPNNATWLSLQVHGDGSGHWLRARVRDAVGRTHLIDFTRNADFFGWETVTARLPNAPGPFTIDQIYMVTLYTYEYSQHRVSFYGLQALVSPTNNVQLPANSQFFDVLHGTFLGLPNVPVHDFIVPVEVEYYSAEAIDNFVVITMAASDGGISDTDRSQWGRFMQDIRSIDAEYVVILMDANPLTDFRQQMEFELFHLAMQELVAEGRLVFVVSATGEGQTLTKRDRVRYIDLESSVITFRTHGGDIRWQ